METYMMILGNLNHSNVVTGQKDLIGEQIKSFMDTINPRWNWG
ncbi:hypothetical protein DESME_02160 [Desulfitobacterium metallireducens DSM 15288]|uniref:Uncharacterized protein n=1 Tax=Desulfitobacterium metallireducens DSM 15288 TaxID=871968 RepID=W0ECC0_9FIRM|nr:hypothetical protein DESME_02160 [Desulfitobacterium metallireducens DSM 15288]